MTNRGSVIRHARPAAAVGTLAVAVVQTTLAARLMTPTRSTSLLASRAPTAGL
jgi:hypothetical protein